MNRNPMQPTRPTKLTARGVALEHYNERTKQTLPVLAGIDLTVREGFFAQLAAQH